MRYRVSGKRGGKVVATEVDASSEESVRRKAEKAGMDMSTFRCEPVDASGAVVVEATPPPVVVQVAQPPTHTPAADEGERDVWSGTPSQLAGFWTYFWCFVFCWLLVPILIAVGKYIALSSTRWELTTQRLKRTTGMFSRKVEEIELYRVKDTSLSQSFTMRLRGLGDIVIQTSDRSTPSVVIGGVSQPAELREQIRELVNSERRRHGVREFDNA